MTAANVVSGSSRMDVFPRDMWLCWMHCARGHLSTFRCVVLRNAQLFAILWELAALQVLRPLEVESPHNCFAEPCTFAQAPTRWNGIIENSTDRCVQGAKKELKIRTAVDLDEWYELMNLQSSFLLLGMTNQVWHNGFVVLDIRTEGNCYHLTTIVMLKIIHVHAGYFMTTKGFLLLDGRSSIGIT